MPLFDTQPIKTGCGPVHVNRFRIAFRAPTLPATATPGSGLFGLLPSAMNPNTARAERNEDRPFNGLPTLCFHGRAKIRAFDLPFIPLPIGPFGSTALFPTPDALRHLELPPFHTDHVGGVHASATGFTVQTLTRNFARPEDGQIRDMVEQTLKKVIIGELMTGLVGIAAAISTKVLGEALLEHALWVNRHHFLAGRRSFRLDRAERFGHKGGSDIWVFETAAVERFALPEFEKVTDYLLGGDKVALGPVWKEMCRRLAPNFGQIVTTSTGADTREGAGYWQAEGGVLFMQKDVASLGSVKDGIAGFSDLHPALFDPG